MDTEAARVADTAAWLAKASLDLRSAQHAMAASEPLREDAVFHCQQAVEKAMKALLTWHDVVFRRTHSLEELGQQCVTIDPGLRPLVAECVPLSAYAWQFRYPGEPDPPTSAETAEALRSAHAVFTAILDHLPPSTHPESQ